MDVNPLIVIMAVRHFSTPFFYIQHLTEYDKLIVRNYSHEEAHNIVRTFFREHKEYTHLFVWCEDIIATPDQALLLISDSMVHDFPVISGYVNWDLSHLWINATKKDMRKTSVQFAENYDFLRILDVLHYPEGEPFLKVFFVGLPFTLIRRDVEEAASFTPYKYIQDKALGKLMKRGIMFDLQFCNECADKDIPINIDRRLLLFHYGNTVQYIHLDKAAKSIQFIPRGI